MKYFQVFYNASECGLFGSPGFGIRTATEGMPESWLKTLDSDEQMKNYLSGDFELAANVIFEHPERIVEFPRSYFFKRYVSGDGQEFYALGRIVNVCFDFPFYNSGAKTRPGNMVNYVLVFDAMPPKEVFDLLFENPAPGSLRFLPVDFTPRVDNPEMKALMLGKPAQLPVEELPVKCEGATVPADAISLYFQILDILARPVTEEEPAKPIVVKAKAADSGALLAGLMRLAPKAIAKELTFYCNHQENGALKGVKLTLVNEYYGYTVYKSTCNYIDLLEDRPEPTALELMYRSALEAALAEGNGEKISALCEWIASPLAKENLGKGQELNLALFSYIHDADSFTLEQADMIPGLLTELKKHIGADPAKASLINDLLSAEFKSAESIEDYKVDIALAEKVRTAGIDTAPATAVARECFTAFSLESIPRLSEVLGAFGSEKLNRYADVSTFPALGDVLLNLAALPDGKPLAQFLQPEASERVKLCVKAIKENPATLAALQPYLDMDKAESDKVDWLKELEGNLDYEPFAELFYTTAVRNCTLGARERLELYHSLSLKNEAFKVLLLQRANQDGSFSKPYNALATPAVITPDKFAAWAEFIREKVLSLLPSDDSVAAGVQWSLLEKVLTANVGGIEKPSAFYDLALSLGADDAVKAIVPLCLEKFHSPERVKSLVQVLDRMQLKTQDEIVEAVKGRDSEARREFWIALSENAGLEEYAPIAELAGKLGIEGEELDALMKEHFSKQYKANKFENSFMGKSLSKVGGWFSRKDKGEKEEEKPEEEK